MIAIAEGALFQGTQATSELIPALLAALEDLDGNARAVGTLRADDIRRALPNDPNWLQSPDAEGVVEELICALSDCAGTDELYFGRRAPGSTEFGFWRCAE